MRLKHILKHTAADHSLTVIFDWLKDYDQATTRRGKQLGANWLREELQAGNLKMEDLTPKQKQLLEEYPEEQTE